MTTYESGAVVRSGWYLNASRRAIEVVAEDGARLPAGAGRWVRVPAAVVFVLVPVLGATFLVFLPLIGFVLAARALATPLVVALAGASGDLAATVSPGWSAGEVHFTGRPAGGERGTARAEREARLDALEREIAERRRLAAR